MRGLRLIVVLLVTSVLAFGMLHLLPGDPTTTILGEGATPQAIQALRAQLHLDDPVLVQYFRWLGEVCTGNFGRSPITNQDVLTTILEKLPVSLELMILAQGVALVLAVPMALYAAARPRNWFARLSNTLVFGALAIPDFVLAIVLILVLTVQVHAFPAAGWVPLSENPLENLRSAFLPALTLAIGQLALYQRVLRSDALSSLQQDYVQFARSKGLSTPYLLIRHVLRPSLVSLVTLMGINIGRLIGGAIVVETVFALPGVGQLMVNSLTQRDLVMVQGVVVFVALTYVLVNMVIDVAYVTIDPRLRSMRTVNA